MTTSDPDAAGDPDAALVRITRWEAGGGVWQVLRSTPELLEIALLTCSAGEEMGRFTSSDPRLRAYVGGRARSDD